MKELMQNLREAALRSIAETADMEKLEAQRVKYLGKKGELTAIRRGAAGHGPACQHRPRRDRKGA